MKLEPSSGPRAKATEAIVPRNGKTAETRRRKASALPGSLADGSNGCRKETTLPASLSVLREFKHLEGRRVGSGLNVEEFERWMRLKLELDAMRAGAPNRRQSFRIATHLLCSLAHGDEKRRTVISNLSERGAFIQTRAPLPVDSRLELTLDTDDSDQPIHVQAVVVSTQIDLQCDPSKHGMGVRFTNVTNEMGGRLGKFYQDLCLGDSLDQAVVAR